MNIRWMCIMIACTVLLGGLAACGSSTPPASQAATPTPSLQPPTAVADRSTPPEGTYTTTITQEDYQNANLPDYDICMVTGTFTLTIAGERWLMQQEASPGCTVQFPLQFGSWELAGEKDIKFHNDLVFCQDSYRYSPIFQGEDVSLIKIVDDCPPRETWLSSHPWTKSAVTASIPIQYQDNSLWEDATKSTIGMTWEWSNMVELADLNEDGLVDLLFANGGEFSTPGTPELSRVFLNQGPGNQYKEITESVFGLTKMFAKVIKVRDVNGDGHADILVGTPFQSQSRMYLGDGSSNFTEVTATHLPQMEASIIDLELGDVDGDGDLDILLADWGPGDPMNAMDGRTLLWLNDGAGHFSDATATGLPDNKVKFPWDVEFVDTDNDYDLDILVSCKEVCGGSLLYENDGKGNFSNITPGNLPVFARPYDFNAMDLNQDGYLDLVSINEEYAGGRIFINNQHGGFEDATAQLWPAAENLAGDDGMAAFLDYDFDGDADFVVGNLWVGADRLLINDGSGKLISYNKVFGGENTPGTLWLALADLNGDGKMDVVMSQGENPGGTDERVFLGEEYSSGYGATGHHIGRKGKHSRR